MLVWWRVMISFVHENHTLSVFGSNEHNKENEKQEKSLFCSYVSNIHEPASSEGGNTSNMILRGDTNTSTHVANW